MTQIGTGGQDWAEIDLTAIAEARWAHQEEAIEAAVARLALRYPDHRWEADLEPEPARILCDGVARYETEVRPDGRVVVTSLLHPDELL